ncbi:hypothetical protein M9458_039129, partial [Cirrhinus mrigala]
VLLKNMSTVSIPAVMDPLAFESVLSCAYTGQLRMLREDIVNYLTVGSVLQMAGEVPVDLRDPETRRTQDRAAAPTRRTFDSSTSHQSPSSTNYFSPRDANFGGTMVTTGAVGEGAVHSTPTYCMPSGGEEGFMIEEDEEDDDELLFPRKRDRGGKRKVVTSVSDQEVGVSDSFGVSSYQDGDSSPPQKRPSYSQPSIMPRKQWVVVKTEHSRDDDLIVVSGGEEGADDEEEREMEMVRERDRTFNISNVRTLSGLREDAEMEAQ